MAEAVKQKASMLSPIERHIYLIHGHKVMLDADLAALYEVDTKRINEAVRRNAGRFPQDFMFQLTSEEVTNLRSQFATSRSGHGGRRTLPYAFTEHGVFMLSSVLNSERAIRMNILIVRAFVRLREMIASNKDLALRVEKLEARQDKTVSILNLLVDEIGNMKKLPPPSKRRIWFDI